MVSICFAVYVLANNTRVIPYFYCRVWPPGDHTRLKIWYNLCIIRPYIHGKTDGNHVLFSKSVTRETDKDLFLYSFYSLWLVQNVTILHFRPITSQDTHQQDDSIMLSSSPVTPSLSWHPTLQIVKLLLLLSDWRPRLTNNTSDPIALYVLATRHVCFRY